MEDGDAVQLAELLLAYIKEYGEGTRPFEVTAGEILDDIENTTHFSMDE